jgi:Lrp/AsnC family transcriptional regulator of ectoine degradation
MNAGRPRIDRLDYKILAVLRRDGRITKTDLGSEVGLSASRCWERMQRLVAANIIRGYHADVDLRKLAKLSQYHVHVRLLDTSPAGARRFEQLISKVHAIVSCQAVLGTVDYVLTVVAPDTETFRVIMQNVSDREAGRFEFVTFPVSKVVKSPQAVGLLELIESVQSMEADEELAMQAGESSVEASKNHQ